MDIVTHNERWALAEILRSKIAAMIHCDPAEIAFGPNSSTLFNIFANGIGLIPGDNVITYDSAYFAMTYTWINKRQDGVEARIAHAENGRVDAESIMKLADERTRAISVCHVDFGSGFRHDLATLGAFCRERGIYLAVDATQSCGVMQIDAQKMNLDFLTASGYKWLQCILGIGFAYIRRGLLDVLKQTDMGWTCTKDKMKNDPLILDLSENANRFEYGSHNFTAVAGLIRTVDAYLRLGGEDIESYVLSLVDYAYQRASELGKVSIFGDFSPSHRSNIVTLLYPKEWPITREYLHEKGTAAMPLGPGRCRIGIHYYNDREDLDRFFDCLAALERG
jgi:selenocysteine lyase/cysteine desulfurase